MTSNRFNRTGRAVVLLILLLGISANAELSFILTNSAPAAVPRRPNIILILADGLGYGDLSCYGQTNFQTPNLDRLAAGGVRFTNYYAASPANSPARAAILLGRDARHLQQRAEVDVPLTANEITVAQLLKHSGYHTGLIGEWELGDDTTSGAPWKKGFDEFAGYFDPADAQNYYADYMWRYAPKSFINPTNNQIEAFVGKEMIFANTGGKQEKYIPDVYTKAAMNFAVNNTPDAFNRYRPFFLMLNYVTPHANAAETRRSGNGMQVPTDAPFSDETWPQPEKNRAAMIARLDGDVGKLLEQLQKIQQDSNTVIFVSSVSTAKPAGGVDPAFFHSNISTSDLRVPLIVSWPGKIPPGQVSGFRCSAWDFLPTATDIALIRLPVKIDGVSLLPALFGQTRTNRAGQN